MVRSTLRAQREGGAVRDDVCWDFVRSGGKCPRGDACNFKHEVEVPLSALPCTQWDLRSEDSFPEAREGASEKAAVNALLVRLAAARACNKRCLVLDGAHCHTAEALRQVSAALPPLTAVRPAPGVGLTLAFQRRRASNH